MIMLEGHMFSGGRSIQIIYLSNSSNTTLSKYSITSKHPELKILNLSKSIPNKIYLKYQK